ncbi:MAG: ATP synthase F1 subunit epsilon [Sarcina sp.]
MESFKLLIMTPYKIEYDDEVVLITCKGADGEFTILLEHKNYIVSIVPHKISIKKETGELVEFFASGGILEVDNGNVTICTSTVETKEEIDINRAEIAKERASRRLNESEKNTNEKANINDLRAKLALDRAIERINFAKSK